MIPTFLLGDNHGDYDTLLEILDARNVRDAIVIHVGDGHEGCAECGEDNLKSLNQEFASRKVEYLSIRGNHCNPCFFEGQHLFPNLKLLPDYSRRIINGEEWLFKIGKGEWWSLEEFRLDKEKAGPADVLVTHSGPTWIGPGCSSPLIKAFDRAEEDFGTSSLIADLTEERRRHDELFRLVKPKTWYLGHFHERAEKTRSGCRTRIVDCLELIRHSPA